MLKRSLVMRLEASFASCINWPGNPLVDTEKGDVSSRQPLSVPPDTHLRDLMSGDERVRE